MLYILPPPRAPNPPSPWDSILCTAGNNSNNDRTNWANNKNSINTATSANRRPPPRARFRNFNNKTEVSHNYYMCLYIFFLELCMI